jgi:hypothetical protein
LFGDHDIALGHYRRYNIAQLKQLISHAGLKEIESGISFYIAFFTFCAIENKQTDQQEIRKNN